MKIAVIRITGQVGLKKPIVETLHRLRLRRKYACVVFDTLPNRSEGKGTSKPSKEILGMIKKVRDFVAFGEIDDATYKELVEKRGQKDKNTLPSRSEGKGTSGKLKPFFRLHPPRGGIESKKHFGVGKGVLGENKKMNELVGRML